MLKRADYTKELLTNAQDVLELVGTKIWVWAGYKHDKKWGGKRVIRGARYRIKMVGHNKALRFAYQGSTLKELAFLTGKPLRKQKVIFKKR